MSASSEEGHIDHEGAIGDVDRRCSGRALLLGDHEAPPRVVAFEECCTRWQGPFCGPTPCHADLVEPAEVSWQPSHRAGVANGGRSQIGAVGVPFDELHSRDAHTGLERPLALEPRQKAVRVSHPFKNAGDRVLDA